MIKSKTVFIVGAGASKEVGLPTGSEFKNKLSEKLNIQYENGFELSSGDYQIDSAIREHVRQLSPHHVDINPYLEAAWTICGALPQAISIDNILDAHVHDEKIKLCGKLGIVKTILEAEQSCKLYYKAGEKTNYNSIADTWYAQFLKLVTENVQKKDIEKLFTNVSFITFNYDRCIEHYLVNAIATYYAISMEESEKLVNKLVIKHPYGQVGNLPFQGKLEAVKFGEKSRVDLLSVASQVKTFTEQEAEETELQEIHELISEAEILVFLGFGFHELNMQLLDPGKQTKVKKVFATARNISSDDCVVLKNDINDILHSNTAPIIFLNNTLTCQGLFETHWRSLSR